MRRTAFFVLVLFFSLLGVQANAQTKKGDLNGDGNVGKEDVTYLIYKILGLSEGNDAYDVNEDGKTDIADVTCLIGIIASNQQGISIVSCPDDNHPHMIDLGLPSGVKWACCNVGASKPENYGGYYAWGETEVKNDYSFETYIHCDGTQETCHYLGNITGTAYDVAHVKWGEAWRMPTIAERDELIRNCSVETITLYDKFFDKYTGPNGSFIIIPYGGNMYSSINLHEGSDVHSWTSEPLENGQSAHYLYKNGLIGSCLTCMGLTVRPVYDPSFFFSLSEETVDVFVNSTTSVSIEMGSGEYELQYDQTDIIDAELIMADKEEYPDAKDEISIYGVAEGTVTLSVLDKQNNKTATLVVNVKTPTKEDIATTMEYIARVRNYINSLGEISVDVFQSNLLSWLGDQDYVKQRNLSPNKSQIDITFENGTNFIVVFQDMSFFEETEESQNARLLTPWKTEVEEEHYNVSYQEGEEIIESHNVLFAQCTQMHPEKWYDDPDFIPSNGTQERNEVEDNISKSPIALKYYYLNKDIQFLSYDWNEFGMILISQTHGLDYSRGGFIVDDKYDSNNVLHQGILMYVKDRNIFSRYDEENQKTISIIKSIVPAYKLGYSQTIYFGNYCWSYYLSEMLTKLKSPCTIYGNTSESGYGYNRKVMNKFTKEMFSGMTVSDSYNHVQDENYFDFFKNKQKINKQSKKRYFSISTEDVTEYCGPNPIIKGSINGYKNLKSGIDYYVYVYDKDKKFNYEDIVTKGKLVIGEDGIFTYELTDLPQTETPEEYKFIVGFKYGNIIYYGPERTLETKPYSLCPDEYHPHWIDLGLPSGTKWRCCNEGASVPEAYGGYYTFGQVSSAPSWDQIKELYDNTTSLYTTQNGVNGRKYKGANGGAIFLPVAGARYQGESIYAEWGAYWSSTPDDEDYAYFLSFNSDVQDRGWASYGIDMPVRPVR